jgi:hypothetical protein
VCARVRARKFNATTEKICVDLVVTYTEDRLVVASKHSMMLWPNIILGGSYNLIRKDREHEKCRKREMVYVRRLKRSKRSINVPDVGSRLRGQDCVFYLSTNFFFLTCFHALHSLASILTAPFCHRHNYVVLLLTSCCYAPRVPAYHPIGPLDDGRCCIHNMYMWKTFWNFSRLEHRTCCRYRGKFAAGRYLILTFATNH